MNATDSSKACSELAGCRLAHIAKPTMIPAHTVRKLCDYDTAALAL